MTACFIQSQGIWQSYEVNWIEFKESIAGARAKWEGLKS